MSSSQSHPSHIPPAGALLLLLVCLLWGGNFITIKVSNHGIGPLTAAAVRSAAASLLLWAFVALKGQKVWLNRDELKYGIIIGFLFGMDFLFLYWGLLFTNASRAVVFLYAHPLFVAILAHFLLVDDRLTVMKSVGLILAFGGLLAVFGAHSVDLKPYYWVGDLMELAAAMFWASTTIYIKKVVQGGSAAKRTVTHYQTLFAQLFFSIPVLALGAILFEWGRPLNLTGPVLAALGYQTLVIAFFSYILWFWMIHTYPVSRLTAFTFLTPLFGVIMSGYFLNEAVPALVWLGLVLVCAGIYLVNRPQAAA